MGINFPHGNYKKNLTYNPSENDIDLAEISSWSHLREFYKKGPLFPFALQKVKHFGRKGLMLMQFLM